MAQHSRPLAFQLTPAAAQLLAEAQSQFAAARAPDDKPGGQNGEAAVIYQFDLALESVRARPVRGGS